jgi:hypothetical protein
MTEKNKRKREIVEHTFNIVTQKDSLLGNGK